MNYETLWSTIQSYVENTEALFVANIPVFVQQAETRIYNSDVSIPALRKVVTSTMTASSPYMDVPNDYLATSSLAVIDGTGAYNFLLNKDISFIREAYPSPASTGMPKHYALFGSQLSSINDLRLILGPTPNTGYSAELLYFYYPPTIVKGQVSGMTLVSGGGGYTNGTYQNVSMTGGSGTGLTADIVVSGGAITSCTVAFGGNFYVVGDTLTASLSGASASGFSVTVSSVSNATGTSWLGDNYDPVLLYGAMVEAMLFMKQEQDLVTYYETKYKEALAQLDRLCSGLEQGDVYRDGQAKAKVNP